MQNEAVILSRSDLVFIPDPNLVVTVPAATQVPDAPTHPQAQ